MFEMLGKYWWIVLIIAAVVLFVIWKQLFTKDHSKTPNPEISKALGEFSSDVEKYSTLKKSEISSISDDKLRTVVTSWMWGKFNDDWSNQYEVISSLPKPCQNIYSAFTIEGEVNNGGFNQCYFNSNKEFAHMAEEGFAAIDAPGFADIMTRANTIYKGIEKELEKYDDGSIESFMDSYEDNPLNDFDTEFYNMYRSEPLEKLYIQYIREHADCFGD